jgi:single-strand DNA-binding protein
VVLQRFRGELTMLDSRGGESGDFTPATPAEEPDWGGSENKSGGATPGGAPGGDLDDEIPF